MNTAAHTTTPRQRFYRPNFHKSIPVKPESPGNSHGDRTYEYGELRGRRSLENSVSGISDTYDDHRLQLITDNYANSIQYSFDARH